jgi:hypothetical protein
MPLHLKFMYAYILMEHDAAIEFEIGHDRINGLLYVVKADEERVRMLKVYAVRKSNAATP